MHGHSWQRSGHPSRIRATYNREHGVRHYISSYDLAADRLVMRCYRRKRWQEFLSFLKTLRRQHSRKVRLHVVLDNFSPHRRSEVVRWAKNNNVRLVFTPTYASWLNRIEPLFAALRYFALKTRTTRTTKRLGGPSTPTSPGATGDRTTSSCDGSRNTSRLPVHGTSCALQLGLPYCAVKVTMFVALDPRPFETSHWTS